MQLLNELKRNIRASGAPITVFIIGIAIFIFIVDWASQGALLGIKLAFWPFIFPANPYSVLTYPFVGNGLISLLFLGFWLWSIGSIVERDLGSSRFLTFWLAVTFLGAFFHFCSGWLTGNQTPMKGLWIPTAAVTVAWGTRYASAPLMFMFAIPMTGKWLAWLAVFLVFFGSYSPVLGFFALMPLGVAYLYAANKLPFFKWSSYRNYRSDPFSFNGFFQKMTGSISKLKKEREEKKRLRKLFERSFKDNKKGPHHLD